MSRFFYWIIVSEVVCGVLASSSLEQCNQNWLTGALNLLAITLDYAEELRHLASSHGLLDVLISPGLFIMDDAQEATLQQA